MLVDPQEVRSDEFLKMEITEIGIQGKEAIINRRTEDFP
jgi:hypothetical protein